MEIKYYLAIETKPNSYFPINLIDLKISNNFTTTKLDELDNFTLKFTKQEIIDSVIEANMLNYQENMSLVVIYSEKNVVRKAEVLTKEISFNMWSYLKDNYDNKNILNKIHNFLKNKIPEEKFIAIKNAQNCNEFITLINNLPYEIERKLYFYLYEK